MAEQEFGGTAGEDDREDRAAEVVRPEERPAPAAAHPTRTATRVAARTGTTPATAAPSPSGRAAGTPTRAARVRASLAVVAETAAASAPSVQDSPYASVSAATWASSTRTRVTTPNGPMSDCFMIRRASSAGLPLPSPSAVSASPSRWRPRVRTAGTATEATAASSGPVPRSRRRQPSAAAPRPTTSPAAGAHSIPARAASRSQRWTVTGSTVRVPKAKRGPSESAGADTGVMGSSPGGSEVVDTGAGYPAGPTGSAAPRGGGG